MSEYVTGTLDGNIHEFALGMREVPTAMSYALITCLDSCQEPAHFIETSPPLQSLKDKITIVGDAVLLSTKALVAVEQHSRLFFGFDEVWFVSHRKITRKPKSLLLVGGNRPRQSEIAQYESWLKQSGCSLALGDGVGMTFCVKARGATRLLLEAANEPIHA